MTPSGGAAAIGSYRLTTANDSAERDPTTIEIYGTDDAIVSTDNSAGQDENWTLIVDAEINLPDDRLFVGDLSNLGLIDTYTSYKVIFGEVKGGGKFHADCRCGILRVN